LPNLVTVSDGFGAKFGSSMSDGVNMHEGRRNSLRPASFRWGVLSTHKTPPAWEGFHTKCSKSNAMNAHSGPETNFSSGQTSWGAHRPTPLYPVSRKSSELILW